AAPAGGGFRGGSARTRLDFTVALTPPLLDVPGPLHTLAWQPLSVPGRSDPGARVTVAGRVASVDDHGSFVVTLPAPQPRVVRVVATDPAGNSTQEAQQITVAPRRPPAPVRGVHVSADAWHDRSLRQGVVGPIPARP